MIDIRPRPSHSRVFFVDCTVTPVIGEPYASKVMRVPPSAPAPNINADGVIVDTNPRFTFWKSDLADATIVIGDHFEITEGADAGTYSVERVDDVDGEVIEVVCLP